MSKAKKNLSIKERLAVIETVVTDIKDNHLKGLCNDIRRLSNRFWWLIGLLILTLLGILARKG